MHMNTKVLLAGLAAGVVAFLLGGLVYGMALKGFMDEHTTRRAMELMKPRPDFIYLCAGHLVYGLMFAWVLSRMGANAAISGAMAGLMLAGSITLAYGLMYYGLMDMYKGRMIIAVDVVVNALMGGVVGAVAGLILGMGKKATA